MSEETKQMGARFPVQLADAVEEAAHESRTSTSEVLRTCCRFALIESEDFEIPEWLESAVEAQKEKRRGIERRKKIGLLENRIPRQMDRLFTAQPHSWHPESVEKVMQSYVAEAEAHFGEGAEEVEEVREKIAEELEDYREAYTASNWNPDSENRYMQMSGPEAGAREDEIERQGEAIAEEIRQRIKRREEVNQTQGAHPAIWGKGQSYDPSPSERVDAILDAIANERGVDREQLESMLFEAFEADSMQQLSARFVPDEKADPALRGATSDD